MGTVAMVTREGGNAMPFVLIETCTAGLVLDTGWQGWCCMGGRVVVVASMLLPTFPSGPSSTSSCRR